MKKFFALLAVTAGFAVLAPVASQARDSHHHDHHSSSRSFSHECRSCGTSVYRERVYLGRDRHGHPRYDWRTISHSCRSSHGHGHGGHGHSSHGGSRGHVSFPGFHIDIGGRR